MRKSSSQRKLDYKNRFMEIHHTRADFGGFKKDYFVIDLGPRAGIVIVRAGEVLLTRQYRFLIDDLAWEIPGGRVDPGETPEQAAIRECLEETGVRCAGLRPLVVYYPGLDNFDNRTTLFFTEQAETVAPFVPDPAEVVELRWVALDECLEMVADGRIMDALTVTGLLAYAALGRRQARFSQQSAKR